MLVNIRGVCEAENTSCFRLQLTFNVILLLRTWKTIMHQVIFKHWLPTVCICTNVSSYISCVGKKPFDWNDTVAIGVNNDSPFNSDNGEQCNVSSDLVPNGSIVNLQCNTIAKPGRYISFRKLTNDTLKFCALKIHGRAMKSYTTYNGL